MLDYLTAGITFWMTLFGVQESLLEFRLGYLGRYWFLAISASLLLSFLLSAPITITLIIKFAVDPFTWTGNLEWSGNPFGSWKTALIFLAGGAITGAVTGKALDFYCERVEQRLIQLEREPVEREKLEMEIIERKRILREIALEEGRKKVFIIKRINF